jgi:hypothetical protein
LDCKDWIANDTYESVAQLEEHRTPNAKVAGSSPVRLLLEYCIMTSKPIAIFEAGVTKIRTMADGSPRYEFECPEQAIDVMQALARAQADNKYLMVIVYTEDDWQKLKED